MAAEVGIRPVADAEHGIADAVERRRVRRTETIPEARPVVRWAAVAECAGDDQTSRAAARSRQRHIVHVDQLRIAQPAGEPRGEVLGVAGLRRPQHQRAAACPSGAVDPARRDPGALTRTAAGSARLAAASSSSTTSTPLARTAHTLNSGCSESASTASLVTALTVRCSPCSSFQWNGTKQLPGSHPLGHHGRQHGAAAARRELDGLAVGDVHRDRVDRMQLDERPAVEPVELVDPAGLGHGVPLVLQPAGVEHQREVVIGQFARLHMRAGVEHRSSRRGRKRQPRPVPVGVDEQVLADAVVEVPDRMAVGVVVGRARPLQRRAAQPRVADPAQVVSGCRVGEPPDLVEDLLAGRRSRSARRSRGVRRPGRSAASPGGPLLRRGWRRKQGEVALRVDHHGVGFRPQRGGQHDVGVTGSSRSTRRRPG